MTFSAAVKLALVPAQVLRRQVSWRVLGFMLLGGIPGVLAGSFVLARLAGSGSGRVMNVLLGAVIVLTALYQIAYSFRAPRAETTRKDRAR